MGPVRNRGGMALVMAVGIAMAGMLFLLARVTFQPREWLHRPAILRPAVLAPLRDRPQWVPAGGPAIPVHSRALAISEFLTTPVDWL